MAYLLRSTAGNSEYVTIPVIKTTTSVWSMFVDFRLSQRDFGADQFLLSKSDNSYGRLILRDNSSGDAILTVRTGNSNRDFNIESVDYTQRTKFEIQSDGTDLILIANGTLHETISGGAHIINNGFDYIHEGTGSTAVDLDIYEVYFDSGFTQERRYDPGASNGTGSELIDTISAQNGTLTGFPTDGSQWISYVADPSIFVSGPLTPGGTISGTYADYSTIPTTLTVSDGTNTITVPATIDDTAKTFTGTMPALPTTGTANLVLFGDVTVELS